MSQQLCLFERNRRPKYKFWTNRSACTNHSTIYFDLFGSRCLEAMFKGKLQTRQGRRRGGRGRSSRHPSRRSNPDQPFHRKTQKKLSQKFFIDEDGDCIAFDSECEPDSGTNIRGHIGCHDGRKRRRKRPKHPDMQSQDDKWWSNKWWCDNSWEYKRYDNEWHWDKWCSNHDWHDWQQHHDSGKGAEEMEDVVVEEIEVQKEMTSKKLEPEPVPPVAPEVKKEMPETKSCGYRNMCHQAKAKPMQTKLIAPKSTASKVIHSISKPKPIRRVPGLQPMVTSNFVPKQGTSIIPKPKPSWPVPALQPMVTSNFVPKQGTSIIPKPKPSWPAPALQPMVTSNFVPKQGTSAQATTRIVPAKYPMQGKAVVESVQCLPKLQQVAVVPKGRKVPPPKAKAPANAWRSDGVLWQRQISADLIAQEAAALAGGIFIPVRELRP